MSNFNINYAENKYFCKHCGNNDMSPNYGDEYVKGWRCNVCWKINYPIKDEILFLAKRKFKNQKSIIRCIKW